MGLVSQFRAGLNQALPPWDDYWYQRPGYDSAAGMNVTPETAMRISAVFACVRVRSESFASCPPVLYQHLAGGGKRRAPEHPVSKVLLKPNIWQTWVDFAEMMQAHLDLRGNAFARVLPGPNGAIDQLVPLHPDLVQVYRLPNGRLKYMLRSRFTAEVDWFLQEEIFHLRGLSNDGLVGLSPIALQREIIGNALAKDDYEGRFFSNGAQPSGVLTYPGKFKDDAAREKYRESWRKAQTAENQHKLAVLEDGMDYKALGVSNRDAEFINSKKLTREEIAGFYRVPPHKIGILERSTNNNIEHQGIEFVTDTMRPAAVRWESRINLDLIEPLEVGSAGEYFVEFFLDGLLRGDLKSRYDAYKVGRDGGWLNPNTICSFEGLNPIAAEKGGDDYLRPANMVVAGSAPATPATPKSEPAPGSDETQIDAPSDAPSDQDTPQNARSIAQDLAAEAAGRVVRKEVAALRKALERSRGNTSAFLVEADRFYSSHPDLIAGAMCISMSAAEEYVKEHRELLAGVADDTADKASVIDWIEDVGAQSLASLALDPRARHQPTKESVA